MRPWFSILPPSLDFIETWAIRTFILLGILVIGPWILLLVYDVILFIFRVTLYDFPIIGGRARNRPRPRAPTLRNRPGGRARALSFSLPGVSGSAPSSPARKTASSGLEEKDGNQYGVHHRSRKAEVLTDMAKDDSTGDIIQNYFLEHPRASGEFDGLEELVAITEETGLTAKQIHEFYERDLMIGEAAGYSNVFGESRAKPIPLSETGSAGLGTMNENDA